MKKEGARVKLIIPPVAGCTLELAQAECSCSKVHVHKNLLFEDELWFLVALAAEQSDLSSLYGVWLFARV